MPLNRNQIAARVARELDAHACTDVSGFGLAGHLGELLRASAVSAGVDPLRLPAYTGAVALLSLGQRSTYHDQNAALRRGLHVEARFEGAPETELLFDPQTAGGLLLSLPAERAEEAQEALRAGGDAEAAVIGRVEPLRSDGALFSVAELATRDGVTARRG